MFCFNVYGVDAHRSDRGEVKSLCWVYRTVKNATFFVMNGKFLANSVRSLLINILN